MRVTNLNRAARVLAVDMQIDNVTINSTTSTVNKQETHATMTLYGRSKDIMPYGPR